MSDFSVGVLGVLAVFIIPALCIFLLRILNRRAASRGHIQRGADNPRQNMLEKNGVAAAYDKTGGKLRG